MGGIFFFFFYCFAVEQRNLLLFHEIHNRPASKQELQEQVIFMLCCTVKVKRFRHSRDLLGGNPVCIPWHSIYLDPRLRLQISRMTYYLGDDFE